MKRHGKPVSIRIKTLSGEIDYKRDYYYCRKCKQGANPRDEELGINGLSYKMTRSLMVETAFYGESQPSFNRAKRMIKKALKLDINEETIRQVTELVGEIVFNEDTRRSENTLKNIHEIGSNDTTVQDTVLYIQIDGAAVNTRVQDENGSTWRENKTVLAFRDKDMIRRKDGGHIITKKEYLPLIGSSEEFKKYVLDIAVRAGYGTTVSQVVVIADGASWIRTICNEIFPDAIMILDLYHLRENIYTYAKYKYPNDAARYTAWAESAIKMVENGQAEKLLELLPEGEKLPNGCVNLRHYITSNLDRIKYQEYWNSGYFVGSGAIESGNKLIVQQRLKQAGMRWSVSGAQSVLSLRAKDESNLWEDFVLPAVMVA